MSADTTENPTGANNQDNEEDASGKKGYFLLLFNLAAFWYNSYAITYNICLGNAATEVLIGVVINLALIVWFIGQFMVLLPRVYIGVPLIILLIAATIGVTYGHKTLAEILEPQVKEDIEKTWCKSPDTAKFDIMPFKLQQVSEHKYQGKASITTPNGTISAVVHVISDGKRFTWRIEEE